MRIAGMIQATLLREALRVAGVAPSLTVFKGPSGAHVDLHGLEPGQEVIAQAVASALGQVPIFTRGNAVGEDMTITGWNQPARVIVVHPTGDEEAADDLAAPWEAIFTPQIEGEHHIMVIGENGSWSGERYINVDPGE
jgi:hypothetical protein